MISTTSSNSTSRQFWEIYRWSLLRHRGLGILYAVLLFLCFPLWGIVMRLGGDPNLSRDIAGTLGGLLILLVMPLAMLFTLILSGMLFDFMLKKRVSDLYYSLPVTRTALLLGRYCAGLTLIIAPVLLNSLIALALAPDLAWREFHGATLGNALLFFVAGVVLAFSFSMFIAVCSGTLLDMMISIFAINVACPVTLMLATWMASQLLLGFYGFPSVEALLVITPYASPWLCVLEQRWQALFWLVLYAVALLVAALLLHRRRPSESAGGGFAFTAPPVVIRAVVTVAAGLGLGLLFQAAFSGKLFYFLLGMLVGSLAAHIVLEAIYSRGFKKMKKSLIPYAATFGVMLIGVFCLATGLFGYSARVPTVDEVQSVQVTGELYQYYGFYYGFADNGLGGFVRENGQEKELVPTLQNPEGVQKVINLHQQLIQSNPFDLMGHQSEISSPALTLRYQLKDGSSFSRTYRFSETDAPAVQQCAAAVWDDEEFKTTGSVLFFITPEDIDSLYVEIYWYGQYEGSDEPPVYDPVNLAGITDAQKTALLQALQADLLADSAQRRYAYFEQGYEDGMEETFIRIWPRDPAPPGQGPMPAFSNCSFAVMPYYANTRTLLQENDWLPKLLEE
ncbi:MAG TPA: hypothetical protein IAA58_12200 [Candidatus Gallacutalibacter stercoravium]|nr:hypothetical protein [Candidatus Gallacutalibacter stercoravium]